MNNYSNMMEFPSVRRVGINSGFNLAGFTGNIFVANLKDFSRGGSLIGIRGSYTLSKTFPLKLGFNVVTDMNQFAGLTDKDDDTYPDVFDDFPEDSTLWNDTDGDGICDCDDDCVGTYYTCSQCGDSDCNTDNCTDYITCPEDADCAQNQNLCDSSNCVVRDQ